jgi:hypothetical protein
MKRLIFKDDEDKYVRFSVHLRPFKLRDYYCKNLGCPCNDVTVELVEVEEDGRSVSNPICFRFKINVETWQRESTAAFSEPIAALIDEFMRDCPNDLKIGFMDELEHRRKTHRKLAEFTMPAEDIRSGILVSYSEVMSDEYPFSGFPAYGHKFIEQGQTFYIDDRYCPNPECECGTVHLVFLRSSQEGQTVTLSEYFLAILSLDGKKLEMSNRLKCERSEADNLVRQWLREQPDVLNEFRWRYKEVRKASRRILKRSGKFFAIRPPAPQIVPVGVRPIDSSMNYGLPVSGVGRNDPCPCKSGKKYKKCCGRNQVDLRGSV